MVALELNSVNLPEFAAFLPPREGDGYTAGTKRQSAMGHWRTGVNADAIGEAL